MQNSIKSVLLLVVAALTLPGHAQPAADSIAGELKTLREERKAVVSDALQLTSPEADAFWPRYREYRAEMDKLGDDVLKLLVEYADAYPDVPEDRAAKLLKDYLALEKDLVNGRARHMQKLTKVLPASKVLRFTQLENRLDLLLRLQMANVVPLVPIEGRLAADVQAAAIIGTGVPGGTVVRTHQLTATVIAIDQPARKLTLMSRDGIKQTVKVGPEAVNFAQIKTGDELSITVTEELVVAVAGEGERTSDKSAGLVALAPVGEKPSGLFAAVTQVTAKITAIDPAQHQVTLQFEDGITKTVAARPDVDLKKAKVGDQVVIRITEAVAIRVSKP